MHSTHKQTGKYSYEIKRWISRFQNCLSPFLDYIHYFITIYYILQGQIYLQNTNKPCGSKFPQNLLNKYLSDINLKTSVLINNAHLYQVKKLLSFCLCFQDALPKQQPQILPHRRLFLQEVLPFVQAFVPL